LNTELRGEMPAIQHGLSRNCRPLYSPHNLSLNELEELSDDKVLLVQRLCLFGSNRQDTIQIMYRLCRTTLPPPPSPPPSATRPFLTLQIHFHVLLLLKSNTIFFPFSPLSTQRVAATLLGHSFALTFLNSTKPRFYFLI